MNQDERSDDGLFIRISLLQIDVFLFSCHNFRPSGLFRFRVPRAPWTVDRSISKSVLKQDKIENVDTGYTWDFETAIPVSRRHFKGRGHFDYLTIYVNCVKL
jgi:hypothetical protein